MSLKQDSWFSVVVSIPMLAICVVCLYRMAHQPTGWERGVLMGYAAPTLLLTFLAVANVVLRIKWASVRTLFRSNSQATDT